MNKKDLSQYRAIKREIDMIQGKIEKLKKPSNKRAFAIDTVMASSKTLPYTYKPVTIKGYGYDATNDGKKHELIKQQRAKLNELTRKFEEIKTFINSIDDSVVRQIIEYKYVDGLSWAATANKVYGKPKESTPRMALNLFFKK